MEPPVQGRPCHAWPLRPSAAGCLETVARHAASGQRAARWWSRCRRRRHAGAGQAGAYRASCAGARDGSGPTGESGGVRRSGRWERCTTDLLARVRAVPGPWCSAQSRLRPSSAQRFAERGDLSSGNGRPTRAGIRRGHAAAGRGARSSTNGWMPSPRAGPRPVPACAQPCRSAHMRARPEKPGLHRGAARAPRQRPRPLCIRTHGPARSCAGRPRQIKHLRAPPGWHVPG